MKRPHYSTVLPGSPSHRRGARFLEYDRGPLKTSSSLARFSKTCEKPRKGEKHRASSDRKPVRSREKCCQKNTRGPTSTPAAPLQCGPWSPTFRGGFWKLYGFPKFLVKLNPGTAEDLLAPASEIPLRKRETFAPIPPFGHTIPFGRKFPSDVGSIRNGKRNIGVPSQRSGFTGAP